MNVNISNNNGLVTAKFIGRLDTAAAASINGDMEQINNMADLDVTLDCTDLEFISSSGLRLFLTLLKNSKAKGGKLVLAGVRPSIMQIFEITGFSKMFNFK